MRLDGTGVFTRECRYDSMEMAVWDKDSTAPASSLWAMCLSKILEKTVQKVVSSRESQHSTNLGQNTYTLELAGLTKIVLH